MAPLLSSMTSYKSFPFYSRNTLNFGSIGLLINHSQTIEGTISSRFKIETGLYGKNAFYGPSSSMIRLKGFQKITEHHSRLYIEFRLWSRVKKKYLEINLGHLNQNRLYICYKTCWCIYTAKFNNFFFTRVGQAHFRLRTRNPSHNSYPYQLS